MLNPLDVINAIYWRVFFEYDEPKGQLARVILWNMMYHLDHEYRDSCRVPSFHEDWAIHRSNITID